MALWVEFGLSEEGLSFKLLIYMSLVYASITRYINLSTKVESNPFLICILVWILNWVNKFVTVLYFRNKNCIFCAKQLDIPLKLSIILGVDKNILVNVMVYWGNRSSPVYSVGETVIYPKLNKDYLFVYW